MTKLKHILESRLKLMEHCAKQHIIPNYLTSVQLEPVMAIITELKYILVLLDALLEEEECQSE